MELMYKDLHITYLEMTDSVLNEGHLMGLIIKDFYQILIKINIFLILKNLY